MIVNLLEELDRVPHKVGKFYRMIGTFMSLHKIALTAAAMMSIATPSHSKDVISEASLYTVKLTTAVDYPFGNDRKGTSRGSGFLVDKERGWILTNAHVASRSPSHLRVSFKDQPYTAAQKVYVDNHLDLAVIKVDPSKIPASAVAANLFCGQEPAPGLPVIAFGHPWNLDYGLPCSRLNNPASHVC